jgi:hypothetical protein
MHIFMCNVRYCLSILTKTEMCRQILVQLANRQFHENPFIAWVVKWGQTDRRGEANRRTFANFRYKWAKISKSKTLFHWLDVQYGRLWYWTGCFTMAILVIVVLRCHLKDKPVRLRKRSAEMGRTVKESRTYGSEGWFQEWNPCSLSPVDLYRKENLQTEAT